jgi:hypothetical protein
MTWAGCEISVRFWISIAKTLRMTRNLFTAEDAIVARRSQRSFAALNKLKAGSEAAGFSHAIGLMVW